MSQEIRSIAYRPDIDGIRAIAILFVVGFHYFPGVFKFGFIGVDIFFVISGYLITKIIANGLLNHNINLINFYDRRIRRIYPNIVVLIFVSISLSWVIFLPQEIQSISWYGLSGITFSTNILAINDGGYFSQSVYTKPLIHLWSLAVEEQFYLMFPLFMRKIWSGNVLKALASLLCLSFIINIILTYLNQDLAYYLPFGRIWELILGSFVAMIEIKNINIKYKKQLSILAAFMMLFAVFLINKHSFFPGYVVVLPVFATALIIISNKENYLTPIISSNYLVYVGKLSYSIYIWHWPILSFAYIYIGSKPSAIQRILLILITIIISIVTYHLYEIKFRKNTNSRIKLWAITVSVLIIFTITCVQLNFDNFTGGKFSQDQRSKAIDELAFPSEAEFHNKLCMQRYPYAGTIDRDHFFCLTNQDKDPEIILIGNSFANHHYYGFSNSQLIGKKTIVSVGVCDAAYMGIVDSKSSDKLCSENNSKLEKSWIDNIIGEKKSLKLAVIDGLNRSPDAIYISALKNRVDFLESHGIQVVIFVPHFKPNIDIKNCIGRPLKNPINCNFELKDRDQLTADFNPLVQNMLISNPKVKFFDQNNVYCNDEFCSPMKNGMPMSRDLTSDGGGHLSKYGSLEIAKSFELWLIKNKILLN